MSKICAKLQPAEITAIPLKGRHSRVKISDTPFYPRIPPGQSEPYQLSPHYAGIMTFFESIQRKAVIFLDTIAKDLGDYFVKKSDTSLSE
jgi:hypothetical protein